MRSGAPAAHGSLLANESASRIGPVTGRPHAPGQGEHKASPLLCDGFASRYMHGGKGTFLSFHPDISLSVSFASRDKIGGKAHEVYIRKSLFLVHLMHRQLFCIERLWGHPHRKWLHEQLAGYSS